jgi:hypothetical protein
VIALDLLRRAYGDLIEIVENLTDADGWLPTGCLGWTVRDLVQHHVLDGQRALVALATPGSGAPDRDAVSYWADWKPGGYDQGINRRNVRTMAGLWTTLGPLGAHYAETLRAVVELAGRADPRDVIATQGHVLTVDDLLSTLIVEAAVHHLDLVAGGLSGWGLDRPGPAGGPLAEVRRVLDGLLGTPAPAAWDDRRWALVGTGRAAPTPDERAALGSAADRLPLFS